MNIMFTIQIFGDVLAGFNASFIKLTNKMGIHTVSVYHFK